jgi:4-hydroxy 2-oxovalerate aldolase
MTDRMILLDTTIRDGSNAVQGGFDEAAHRVILSHLSQAHISYIEVGNGVSAGLNGHRSAGAVSDQAALALGRELAPDARLGALVVPALVPLAALRSLYDHLDFVRLALAPQEMSLCAEYAQDALARGKQVFVQLVKSHLLPEQELVDHVAPVVNLGVDGIYVVDTVGGMDPDQVSRYVGLIRNAFPVAVGFHGHNNTSRALPNSIAAMEAGACFVDGTVGGVGRGAGNLQLELFVALTRHRELWEPVGLEILFECSAYLWSRYPGVARGLEPIEIWYALQGLDSQSRDSVRRHAQERGLSQFQLIAALADHVKGFLATEAEVAAAGDSLQGRRSSVATGHPEL